MSKARDIWGETKRAARVSNKRVTFEGGVEGGFGHWSIYLDGVQVGYISSARGCYRSTYVYFRKPGDDKPFLGLTNTEACYRGMRSADAKRWVKGVLKAYTPDQVLARCGFDTPHTDDQGNLRPSPVDVFKLATGLDR